MRRTKTGIWLRETAAPWSGRVGWWSSIALDSSGNAHIAYNGYDDADILAYTTNETGSWVPETVEWCEVCNMGAFNSIALDSSGNVHISYATAWHLQYATNATGSWIVEDRVDYDPDWGTFRGTSIALDSSGYAHISYHLTGADVRYATNTSESWDNETVDWPGGISYTSIAVDSSGKAHISYYDHTNGDLKYATNETNSWVSETVDSTGDVGLYTSIALDSSGHAHISYYDQTNGNLKYATNAGDGYSATANAEASTYGSDSLLVSGSYNALALLLVPVGAVTLLRILRRRR
jgi:hypothetical protein